MTEIMMSKNFCAICSLKCLILDMSIVQSSIFRSRQA